MSSLLTCIKKAGKAIGNERAAELREVYDDYLAGGMKQEEAAAKAVDDILGLMADVERSELLDLIDKNGGDTRAARGKVSMSLRSRAGKGGLRRIKAGENAGLYVGSPDIRTPGQLEALIKKIARDAKAGEAGRLWYEQSGATILDAFGGDIVEAGRFIGVLAIYSPNTKVDANTTAGLKAWSAYQAGQPLTGLGFKWKANATVKWLNEGVLPNGEKVSNFYNNLMRVVSRDPDFGKSQGVTVDVWMMRALGYPVDAAGEAQYKFAQEIIHRVADRLGWEPQQVQAASWVIEKARTEKKPGETLEQALSKAGRDFSHMLTERMAQLSWEAKPAIDANILPELHSAPIEVQVEFQLAMSMALTDEYGTDLLAKEMNLLQGGAIDGPSAWANVSAHGGQLGLFVGHDGGQMTIDKNSRRRVNGYADILGLILRQEGVAWHRPFFKSSKVNANGMDLNFGRALTHVESKAIYTAVMTKAQAAGLSAEQAQHLAPISTSTGVHILNNYPHVLPNKKFHGIVTEATEETLPDGIQFTSTAFHADTEIRSNNWKDNQNGEEYRDRVSEEGLGDIQAWAETVLGGRIRAVYRDFAKRYGWTYNEGGADVETAASSPVSLDRLEKGGEELAADIYGRGGSLNAGVDTTAASKIYDLAPLIEDPTLTERQLADYGYKLDTFSFHEDKEAGVEIKLPRLGKQNYGTGVVLIYDPRVAHGSFKDEQYTRAWRVTHEMGHAMSEKFMQEKYGDSRRYGRLGREMDVTRGVGEKAVQVKAKPLTLAEAQRAVEWEDVAFRAQRMLLEELGVTISDEQFGKEFNINLTDATYRVLSGDFGNPGEIGFVPHSQPRDLREALRMLENTEKVIAAAQNRQASKGVDLRAWKRVPDDAIRDALADRKAEQKTGGSGVRMSLSRRDVKQINESPDSPQSQWLKLNATVEDQIRTAKQGRRGITEWARDKFDNNKAVTLAAVPLRALVDFADARMTAVGDYIKLMNRASGLENQIQNEIMDLVDPWKNLARKDYEMSNRLAGVMHESTLAGTDPSKPFKPAWSERDETAYYKLQNEFHTGQGNLKKRQRLARMEERKLLDKMREAKHGGLERAYNAMSVEAKTIYQSVRDFNSKQYSRLQQSLEDRIKQTAGADDSTKSALISRIRREFEVGKVDPYFPLGRFGRHWAVAKDSEGNVLSFSKFENPSDIKAWKAAWETQGAAVAVGTDLEMSQGNFTRVDPAFAAEVQAFTDQLKNKNEAKRLSDDIWQAYLKRLPEMSARKAFIHRKGVSGFTGDALRSFADSSFHMARQISKAEYGYQMERAVEAAVEQAEVPRNEGDLWASGVAEELVRRHAWVMEPRVSSWAARLTSFGFHWFLGLNPSSAAVNLSQSWLVGLPVLASYNTNDMTKSAAQLAKASYQMVGTAKQRAERMSADEQKAFDEFNRIGLFDKTRSAELIGTAEGGSVDVTSRWHQAAMVSAKMFHVAEQFNREVTSLAAYRMARDRGEDHETAVAEAEHITWDTHFDYSNKNRPRMMQNDAARVALLFRNYGVNMSYRVLRDLRTSTTLRELPPGQRKAAMTRAVGIWTMTMLNAGAAGLPLVWAIVYAAESLYGDDDDPIDPKDAMRMHLADQFGKEHANWIMDGVMDDITGVALSSRVSLSNLWFMDAPYETPIGSPEWMAHYGAQLLGPLGTGVADAAFGAQLIAEGQGLRGLEKMVPTELRNLMRSVRFAMEGVRTLNDETIVPKDQLTAFDQFNQAAGFTPTALDLQYKENRAKTGILTRLDDRKDELRRRYMNADGEEEKAAAMAAIREFDSKNPNDPIGRTLGQSMRARAMQGRQYQNGVRVPPRMQRKMSKIDFEDGAQ